jgi:hypothetical protein
LKLVTPSICNVKTMVAPLSTNLTKRPGVGSADAGKTSAQGESAAASPGKQRLTGQPGSGALAGLKSRACAGGERLKTAASAGGLRLRAGTAELAKLTGEKLKEKVSEQLTPENIAKAAFKVGKVVVKSAPALAAGPAGIPAFGSALMANGGKEIAESVAGKVKDELLSPEAQQRMLLEGARMAVQAFSKTPETPPAV